MTALVERLCELSDGEGRWRISAEEVAKLLAVEPVRFWRALHGVRNRISFSDAIDGWTQDTVGDLVTVLENLLGAGTEEELTRAGLFLPYALGIELIEEVMFQARRMAAAHNIRNDEFAAMLRHAGNVSRAIAIYFQEHVDLDELLRVSIDSFQVFHDIPQRGKATAWRYLRSIIERHALDLWSLLVGLGARLRLAAAQLGYIDPQEESRAGRRTAARSLDRRAWARQVMGIDGRDCSAEELRLRYRRLMMRHHPDINPAGLEKCKDVNAAYALLISEIREQN
jgi:hypothetical protein